MDSEHGLDGEPAAGWRRFKWPLTLALAVGILGGSFWLGDPPPAGSSATPVALIMQEQAPVAAPSAPPASPTITPTLEEVLVYVSGAVATPGVYHLPAGARADDAVRAAGGFQAEADAGQVNLAARIRDEQHIYIPKVGEATPSPVARVDAVAPPAVAGGKVNLNTATIAELDTLPRIGPATAQRILDYRTSQGPFTTIEDLRSVKGIGAATFDGLKELVSVGP